MHTRDDPNVPCVRQRRRSKVQARRERPNRLVLVRRQWCVVGNAGAGRNAIAVLRPVHARQRARYKIATWRIRVVLCGPRRRRTTAVAAAVAAATARDCPRSTARTSTASTAHVACDALDGCDAIDYNGSTAPRASSSAAARTRSRRRRRPRLASIRAACTPPLAPPPSPGLPRRRRRRGAAAHPARDLLLRGQRRLSRQHRRRALLLADYDTTASRVQPPTRGELPFRCPSRRSSSTIGSPGTMTPVWSLTGRV